VIADLQLPIVLPCQIWCL